MGDTTENLIPSRHEAPVPDYSQRIFQNCVISGEVFSSTHVSLIVDDGVTCGDSLLAPPARGIMETHDTWGVRGTPCLQLSACPSQMTNLAGIGYFRILKFRLDEDIMQLD